MLGGGKALQLPGDRQHSLVRDRTAASRHQGVVVTAVLHCADGFGVCTLRSAFASHGVPLCMQGALTVLKDLAAYPHLANGDYADVNREIKKIITKDSNIQVRVSWCVCLHSTARHGAADQHTLSLTNTHIKPS